MNMPSQTRVFANRFLCVVAFVFAARGTGSLRAQSSPEDLLKAGTQPGQGRMSLKKDSSLDDTSAEKKKEGALATTVINAMKRTKFDPKQNKVVFQGQVQVEDPRFFLKCDLLTAFLKKNAASEKEKKNDAEEKKPELGAETAGTAGGGAKVGAFGALSAPDAGKASGGLESAEAEGNVEIVQERTTPEGKQERTVVRAEKAVYQSSTESITLTGWPEVWQSHSGNSLKALKEDTVMVVNRAGDVDVVGPAKSVFVNPSKNGK